jgi:hypothetical protein
MPRYKGRAAKTEIDKPRSWRRSETARKVDLYSSAYKLALEQIPPAERRARPDISLRIHASIRRQLKQGEMDPVRIASTAIKVSLVPTRLVDLHPTLAFRRA